MSSQMHPDELDLMDYVDGAARHDVSKHVRACTICQHSVDGFADVGEPPSSTPGRAGVDARVSRSVLRALARPLPEEIRAGQLWRARWDDETQLVFVLNAVAPHCRVAPVSLDVHLAGPGVPTVGDSQSPIGLPLGVWTARAVDTRTSLLEQYLGELSAEVVESILDADAPQLKALDDRTVFADRLEEQLRLLAQSAEWEPVRSDERLTLSQVCTQVGLKLSDLVHLLGTDLPTALDLWRGDTDPSASQLSALDQAVSARGGRALPSSAAGPVLPGELLQELARPTWKARLLEARTGPSASESQARWDVAREALALTLAARSRRETRTNWAEVVDRVLP